MPVDQSDFEEHPSEQELLSFLSTVQAGITTADGATFVSVKGDPFTENAVTVISLSLGPVETAFLLHTTLLRIVEGLTPQQRQQLALHLLSSGSTDVSFLLTPTFRPGPEGQS